jgi:predicted CoA-binding protein
MPHGKRSAKQGYDAVPINPNATSIDGLPCYPNLLRLPQPVGAVLCVTPPAVTRQVVDDAIASGVHRLWLQQGAVSADALERCRECGIEPVAGECILMFAHPSGFHKFHGWVWKILGKAPE